MKLTTANPPVNRRVIGYDTCVGGHLIVWCGKRRLRVRIVSFHRVLKFLQSIR